LADEGTEVAAGLLFLDQAVDPTKKDFCGTVATQLAAEPAGDHGVAVERKGCNVLLTFAGPTVFQRGLL
jgi:hypothetical protein